MMLFVGTLLAGLFFAGCGPATPTAVSDTSTPSTPASTDTSTPAPTDTPTPAPLTPLPTSTPTITPTPVIYVIQQGDNLIAIARQYGVTVEAIQDANGILDPRRLQIGQELLIPMDEAALLTPPTPTATPMPLDILGINFQRSPSGVLWCFGEVENIAGVDLFQVEVGVSLFDEGGNMLAFATAPVELDVVPNGQRAPFVISFEDPPERFATYQSVPIKAMPLTRLGTYYLDLEVVDAVGEARGHSSYSVKGRVRNVGVETADHVRLTITAYDDEGKVAAVRTVAPAEDSLPPGRSSDFEIHLLSTAGSVTRYTLHAEAVLSLPTPSPTP